MMRKGQSMNFDSVSPEVPFVQNIRFLPPNNSSDRPLSAEASRKRKSMDTDLGSYVYDGASSRYLENLRGNLGHMPHRESPSHHNVVFPQAIDSQLKTPEMFFYHNSHSAEHGNADSQYGNYRFYDIDNSLLRLQTKDESIQKAAVDRLKSCSFHHKPSFSMKPPVGEIPKLPDSQHLVYDVDSQYEPNKFQSYYKHSGGWMESTQAALRWNNVITMGHGNHTLPCDPYLYPSSMPFKNMTIMDSSNLKMVNEKFHPDGGTMPLDFSKSGQLEVETNDHYTGFSEDRNISMGMTNCTQTSAISERWESYGSFPNPDFEMRSGNYTCNDILAAHMNVRDKEQGGSIMPQIPVLAESSFCEEACPDYSRQKNSAHVSKNFETKIMENQDGSITDNKPHSLGEGTSPESHNSLASRPVELGDGSPLKLEELSKSVAGKVSPIMIEKLWDGSLQLNTSTTVSAVAVFKSGEKAQDINWSEHVEIKGKVRLQAFEKFIQELPRSRNRSLMVISLCWKVGSSKAGLTGMKEVAKGYRESERVGFAQICPGIDLYVCPRSDTIITILAKCGFFKGMAAVEEDQDSLIGCIVWRKSQPSSDPNFKTSEKKKTPLLEQPLNSPEPSLPEMNSPLTNVHDSESKQAKPCMREPEGASSKDSSHGASSFHTNSAPEITPPIPYSSPLIPVQPPTSVQESVKYTEIPTVQSAEPKKPDLGVEPSQPVLPGPLHMLQRVQQMNTQVGNGSHNLRSYNSCPGPVLAPSISLDSPLNRVQLTTTQKPGFSSGYDPVERDSKAEIMRVPESNKPAMSFELTQPVLPGPPPLPPEILQRIIQSSRDARKAPIGGMSNTETSCMHTGEPKKPSVGFETPGHTLPRLPQLLPQAQHRPTDPDDDEEDLPEFDFNSACGVPDVPVSKFPWSSNHTHFQDAPPINKQLSVEGFKNMGGLTPPPAVLPIVKSMEVVPRPQVSCFPAKLLNTYQETTLPTKFGELISEEKKPAAIQAFQPLSQPFTLKADKDSSGCSFQPKSRWDDDDDEMPEWCPPDLEHLDQPTKPSPTVRIPSAILKPASRNAAPRPSYPAPSSTSFRPPAQSQGLPLHGYQPGLLGPRPSGPNPSAPVRTRPAADFVQSGPRPRPPLARHPNHSMRPRATKFNTKPSPSDDSRRWKRQ